MPISQLSDIYGRDKTLFPKYPEPGKDCHHGDDFDFYAGNYGPDVIHTEEGRYLPIVGEMGVLVGKDVVSDTMIEYYKAMYPETFHADSIIPYTGEEYYESVKRSVKNGKLVVPQPYPRIHRDGYYLDPQLIYDLNDKTKLHELTSSIPSREILDISSIRDLTNFPFVLKSNSGASGDGVKIIYDKDGLWQALEWFSSEKNLIVEEYIDAVDNIGIQICISQDGSVEILDAPDQETNEQGEYEGNTVDVGKK